jgi:hypothetical protein
MTPKRLKARDQKLQDLILLNSGHLEDMVREHTKNMKESNNELTKKPITESPLAQKTIPPTL